MIGHNKSIVQAEAQGSPQIPKSSISGLQNPHSGQSGLVRRLSLVGVEGSGGGRSVDTHTVNSLSEVALQGEFSQHSSPGTDQGEPPPSAGGLGWRRIAKEAVGFLLLVPVALMLLNIMLGSILAAVEGWPWMAGWQYCFSIQCGLAQPLGQANTVSPETTWGRLWTTVVAAWTLGFAGALSELCNASILIDLLTYPGRYMAWRLLQCLHGKGTAHTIHLRRQRDPPMLLGLATNATFAVPCMLLLPCLLFGVALSAAEITQTGDCSDRDLGHMAHVIENQTTAHNQSVSQPYLDAAGLPNPLINETPTTPVGQLIAIYVAILTFEVAVISLSIGGELGSGVLERIRLAWR